MTAQTRARFVHAIGLSLALWAGAVSSCGDDGSDADRQPKEAFAIVPVTSTRAHEAEERDGAEQLPEEQVSGRAVKRRQEHAVFDMGANRLLAHSRVSGALHVDAGSAAFAKYVRFDMASPHWRIGVTRDQVNVAVAEPSSKYSAAIDIPLSAHEAATFDTLVMRVHATNSGTWTVKLGGRDRSNILSKVVLREGWQTVRIDVPEGRLVPGENLLAFGPSRSEHALHWFRLGEARVLSESLGLAVSTSPESGADAAPVEDVQLPSSPLDSYDPESRSFLWSEGMGLVFYLYIPEFAHLVADVEGVSDEHTCPVEVSLSTHLSELDGTLAGANAGLSLESLAGSVARVELTARGCAEARVTAPRLTVPGDAVTTHAGPPPKYVVLWIMDTLRADRVRPFQPDARPEVPVLDRLAETGTVFRQYWVQGNESQTSHSSIWTSLYPINHNVRTAGNGGTWRLSRDFEKLPAKLHEAGFHNIGVTANGYVTKHAGYGQNFDIWRNLMREGLAKRNNVPSEQIVEIGLSYLEEHYADGPVFLFLGTIDTHKPWIARSPWIDRYDTEPYSGLHREAAWPTNLGMVAGSMRCTKIPSERDLARINAIYDSNVSYQDAQVGRFLEQLEAWGIADQTMLIVTADHGEELWEVGRCGHGASLRETLVRVPLLVHYPPVFPGRVVLEGAEGVDILPTLLDVLGQPSLDHAQGQSLVALAQGAAGGYPMPSYASQYEYAHAMRIAHLKARVGRSGVPELYDLAEDPGELHDLAEERPIERRFMTDPFSLFLVYRDRWRKRDFGVASNMTERAACELAPKIRTSPNDDHADGEQDPCAPVSDAAD